MCRGRREEGGGRCGPEGGADRNAPSQESDQRAYSCGLLLNPDRRGGKKAHVELEGNAFLESS